MLFTLCVSLWSRKTVAHVFQLLEQLFLMSNSKSKSLEFPHLMQ